MSRLAAAHSGWDSHWAAEDLRDIQFSPFTSSMLPFFGLKWQTARDTSTHFLSTLSWFQYHLIMLPRRGRWHMSVYLLNESLTFVLVQWVWPCPMLLTLVFTMHFFCKWVKEGDSKRQESITILYFKLFCFISLLHLLWLDEHRCRTYRTSRFYFGLYFYLSLTI